MKVVILAGGRGSRLAEETVLRPKPLVEIGDKPILWHIMSIYAHHGFKDFIICAGYKGYQIKEYFINLVLHHSDVTVDLGNNTVNYHQGSVPDWRVSVVDTGLDTLTGGRLKRIRTFLEPGEPFCVTYGDSLADIDVKAEVAFHQAQGRLATMCAVSPPGRFGSTVLEGCRVSEFIEKPKVSNQWINGGFFVLQPEALDLIEGDDTSWEGQPLEWLTAKNQLSAYRHEGFWRPMDTLRERIQLEEMWNSGNAPWKIWA